MDYLEIADRSWPVLKWVTQAHAAIYRITGGRLGARLPGVPPMLLLEHVGGKTGKKYSAPLVYMPDGDDYILVAAKGGHPQDPAWAHNLRAVPEVDVRVGTKQLRVRATEATGAGRDRLWKKAVEYNPLWHRYQERTQRTIPVFVLHPIDEARRNVHAA